ncbi:uncharacterized protein BDZ99DRAFT_463995 [Mytilinidion resinicola]|uniref:Transcription factor tau subunit sfc3/Tfc3 C-terminal domain-containing protein n=1 Tax=Mytilinidion resinicola TaxID=574789 RepID=A0A6A6YKY3_9PEZI|nr:uncharacterized protein BDZ99DRAFT_463995 [Mytilinidion resinicola]KAF2809213.1 hypothetical protein BDZ99DRAFT_463995 [Mytilinidion resinicola]
MPGKHVVANGQDIERPAAESAEQERRRRAGIEGHKHVPGTVWYTYEGSSENGQMAFTTKRAIEDVGAVERPAAKKRRVTFNLPGESSSHANGTQTKQSGLKKPRTALQKAKAAISENAASQLAYLDTVPPGPKRTRKKAAARPVDPNTADSEPKKRPTRRTRRLTRCVIDNDATDKLLYTIVVSKVLAGGIEQNVDWKIIGKVFKNHPKFNMSTFQKRWSTVKSRCTALVDRLTEQFQQHFIEAYEKGQAPTFDFDDPDSYDWVELVDWARNTLKQSSRSILLPEDRAEIYDHYTVEELPKQTDFQDHWYDGTMQTYIREREVADYVYSVPIEKFEVPRVGDPSMKEELLKAKSWLRASVANGAPVGSDAVQSVNEKLSKLDEDYIDEALSSLRGDGAFKLLKKGKNPLLGDDFTLSPAFYKQLNRVWDIDNLNDAVLFKQQLDEIFSAPTADKDNDVTMSGIDTESATPTLNPDARHPISLTLSSGALMVITTLLSTARAKLVPHLPAVDSTIGNPFPRLSVWGWTESNYRAVAMSREHIFWGLDLVPTAAYRFGNPLAENKGLGVGWDVSIVPPPLCQDGKIPIWCDLNESFVYAWWERAVVAVLGHLVLRAPASVASLSVALAKILERWEIERIVGWLVDVGAASFSADGSRVMPGDYWWCVLGTTDAGKVEVEKRRKIREVEAAAQKAKKKTGPPKGWRKPRPQVSGINIGYPITAAEDDGEWDGALLELAGVTGSGGEDDGSGVEDGADEVGEHDEGENGDVDGDGDVIMEG